MSETQWPPQEVDINGRLVWVQGDPARPLLTVLRDELGLTGAKYGCGERQCGACVVIVGDHPAPACDTPVGSIGRKRVQTIEGLAAGAPLHPIQEAFIEADALQCGYCTPGMIMGVVFLLQQNPHPTDNEIVDALQKHVCRCGTYRRIIRAVHLAAEKLAAR